jgi:NADH dehydrogenase
VHVFGARAVAEAARGAGIANLTHVSVLGANPDSASDYYRSKSEGEAAVLETNARAVVFRPSLMFGPEDHFFNRFAAMARVLPAFPLIGGGQTKMQPVFAGDVASAIADSVEAKYPAAASSSSAAPRSRRSASAWSLCWRPSSAAACSCRCRSRSRAFLRRSRNTCRIPC